MRCAALRCAALRCAALRCAALRCAALRCAAVLCSALWRDALCVASLASLMQVRIFDAEIRCISEMRCRRIYDPLHLSLQQTDLRSAAATKFH
jgi:hypothetical protein